MPSTASRRRCAARTMCSRGRRAGRPGAGTPPSSSPRRRAVRRRQRRAGGPLAARRGARPLCVEPQSPGLRYPSCSPPASLQPRRESPSQPVALGEPPSPGGGSRGTQAVFACLRLPAGASRQKVAGRVESYRSAPHSGALASERGERLCTRRRTDSSTRQHLARSRTLRAPRSSSPSWWTPTNHASTVHQSTSHQLQYPTSAPEPPSGPVPNRFLRHLDVVHSRTANRSVAAPAPPWAASRSSLSRRAAWATSRRCLLHLRGPSWSRRCRSRS